MRIFRTTLMFIGACIPFVVLSWIAVSPSGERTVSWSPDEFSPFITSPLPGERVSGVSDGEQGSFVTLTGEPVYIGVFPPSPSFTHATVTVEFDPHQAYAFEIGGLTNLAAYAFDFHALANRTVESLSWAQLPSNALSDVSVFARGSSAGTVQDFLNHTPDRAAVVTYRASLPGAYRDPSYVPLNALQTFSVSLRGSHEYVTYVKNERFQLDVTYQDINRTYGVDDGFIRVVNEFGVVVASRTLSDDGNVSEDQRYATKSVTISGDGWPEGVYRVELSGTSDVVWRTLATRQRYMAFKNRLFIADDVGYLATDRKTAFVTNSKSLVFETLHANSAHAVTLGSEVIELPLPHTKVRAHIDADGVVSGVTDAGDVKMTGEGKFALSRGSFFDPDPRSLTVSTNLEDGTLAYLVADIPPVMTTPEGWRTASAVFDLSTLVKETDAYKFALSLPGRVVDEESIDIHRIIITFHKDPLSLRDAILEELRAWKRGIRERIW